MPISLVHIVEINHQSVNYFQINQHTTALIANQIRMITKPEIASFWVPYDDLRSIIGRSDKEIAANKVKASDFGKKYNISVDITDISYSFESFDIVVTLSDSVETRFKFLTLEDAEKSYVELLTAASLSQVAQEKKDSV